MVDKDDRVQSNRNTWRRLQISYCIKLRQAGNNDTNQLDGKQCHTGFDYYEQDMLKFGILGRAQAHWAQCSLNRSIRLRLTGKQPRPLKYQEHLEDFEHDQARHQGIHDHGYGQTC